MPKYVSMEQLIAEVQKYPGEYRYSSIPKWAIEELINGGYRLDEMRVLIDAGDMKLPNSQKKHKSFICQQPDWLQKVMRNSNKTSVCSLTQEEISALNEKGCKYTVVSCRIYPP